MEDDRRDRRVDIYFDKDFPKLYENIEDGIAEEFLYENEVGIISHRYIKRAIPIETSEKFFDIVTPYGYGGPVIVRLMSENRKRELVNGFALAFGEHCQKEKIVSEFVRFHPLVKNADDFHEIYETIPIRTVIGTDLEKYPDFFENEFSKRCRKNIRKALNHHITFEFELAPHSLTEFKEIYYSTMDRNEASEYYYFGDEYFAKCLKYYNNNILLVKAIFDNKVIAASFCFVWDKVVHIHLSGTLTEYLHLSPAYILRYAVAKWGVENGYKLIYHGGGKSNDSEDTLLKFKKQFGTHTEFPFYIGKKIWNKDAYNLLCELTEYNDDFFPKYRRRT